MGILANPRHERFVQALFEGKPQNAAYEAAGYRWHEGNASRLRSSEKVKARLAELQGAVARSTAITIESICAELDDAIAVARGKHQAQAMVSASGLKAKLNGLMIERVEHGPPGSFDGMTTIPQIADQVLALLIEQFTPVDEQDRQGLIQLYERHVQEAEDYLASIRARPITAERTDPRHLDRPWQTLQPRSAPLRLRSNGAG